MSQRTSHIPHLPTSPAETHEVRNQPPPLVDHDPWSEDAALREGVTREGGEWASEEIHELARELGRAETIELGHAANRHEPVLRNFDRFGHRIDEVDFHPSWHRLMTLGKEAELHCLPWSRPREGAHVARAAKHYLFAQVEAGVLCPLTMTSAAVPALRRAPEVAEEWVPRLLTASYDERSLPSGEKSGCLVGMAMTEKQGGSDVRANTTRAERASAEGRDVYRLTGHKWFCSAPMSDAFLTLAQTDEGLTCFLVPRFVADGSRNRIFVQRLKDKLGNRSNASSEIEYHGAWARRVGDPGRGVPTIIEMVNHTRLDCVLGTAGMMRRALAEALHHAAHRQAFGRRLRDQPLMQQVLADLALEVEAATALGLRLARAYDSDTPEEKAFRRIATAIAKYWVCKRGPSMAFEAMECLGGNGYVEESVMPRIYREMPVNSIWEGSGNVICLDVMRALAREPETGPALRAELERARGADRHLDRHLDEIGEWLEGREKGTGTGKGKETGARTDGGHADVAAARRRVEGLALALQAGLLHRAAPNPVAEAFSAGRLERSGLQFGTLPAGSDVDSIVGRAAGE